MILLSYVRRQNNLNVKWIFNVAFSFLHIIYNICSSIQQRAPGKILLDAVCNHLNLVEGDYFGLEFLDHKKVMVCKDILPKSSLP